MTALDIAAIQRALPGRQVEYFATIPSTMQEAARLAAGGCTAGTAVIAEEQTAGQGRHGHAWHSEAGSGLYVSIVLRPRITPDALPVMTLALGLATAEAIARSTGVECDLRWPNDLMIQDRKTAGILAQLADSAVIAGIGININHAAFPPELAGQATSLRIAAGYAHSREDLLICLLPTVDALTRMMEQAGRQAILRLFARRSSYVEGLRVTVEQPGGAIEGITAGLDPSGFLIVRRDDGTRQLVVAGGVRAART